MGSLICYFLIGLPATGKSTFCDVMNLEGVRVSSDDYVENVAFGLGSTYDEVWNKINPKDIDRWLNNCLEHAVENNKNIVWDQTNLSTKNRKKKLDKIPETYYKIAIVFETPADHEQRLNNRPGKTIPSHVIKSMKDSYEPPEYSEGFDLIYYVK